MDLGLKGKSALVTGGSKGIGLAIAELFAAEGANVAICARNADEVGNVVKKLSAKGDYTQIVDDGGWFPGTVVKWPIIERKKTTFQNFLRELAFQHTVASLEFFRVKSQELYDWAERFQAEVEEAAPALEARLAARAAATETAAPADDASTAELVAELLRYATPEQRQFALPIDPQSLVDAPSGAPGQ